jgi:nitrous-oxide reductase
VSAVVVLAACGGSGGEGIGGSMVQDLMQSRSLNEADVLAALKTYTPTGRMDPFVMFASGGHSGQVIVIGVPSMRILKYIGVFTPEPWQGYGFDDQTKALLASSSRAGRKLTWGDSHHPALSETDGDYDGQFLFINDKANARVAVIRSCIRRSWERITAARSSHPTRTTSSKAASTRSHWTGATRRSRTSMTRTGAR